MAKKAKAATTCLNVRAKTSPDAKQPEREIHVKE